MSTDLSALRKRVEGADGPDREIDAEIQALLDPAAVRNRGRSVQYGSAAAFATSDPDEPTLPAYTASLDAALGLVEARLPGREIVVVVRAGAASAVIVTHETAALLGGVWRAFDSGGGYEGEGPTPALALISALLHALETQ